MLLCSAVTAANAATRPGRPVTVVFKASLTDGRSAGPDADHAGHRQIASSVLWTDAERAVGRFKFTCTWTRILAGGAALERRAGSGRTADGRLDVAGPARQSEVTHSWKLTGRTGGYRGAHGTVLVRDISDRESLITATVTPRTGKVLHVAVIARPAANASFITTADQVCSRTSRQLAALPPFPFGSFDPLHPDPALLPGVGRFFTGPGDPRPIFHTLDARLQALGRPPGGRGWWKRMLHARTVELAVIGEQDTAALGGDVPAFVNSVRDSMGAFGQIAISATVFGATRCVL